MATSRDAAFRVALVKLTIFTLVSLFFTGLLSVIMGHFALAGETTYKAIFSNASMLISGDDVRVAGVSVGQVKDVQIYDRTRALVTFGVDSSVPITTKSRAEIRFLNLVGNRYMALDQGTPGAPRLAANGTLPMSQTQPALNLTALFNGFQPLFAALTPHDVNQLSMNLIQVLQGEGGNIADLLNKTGSLTNTIADRSQLVGQVIDNLTQMLTLVDDHHQQLNTLVLQLRGWMGKLAGDRKAIGDSLQNISGFSAQLASLLTQGRPYLKNDLKQLERVMAILAKKQNQKIVAETLHRLPESLARQTRTGTYGSWYNYYLCNFNGQITLPASLPNVPLAAYQQLKHALTNFSFHSTAARCR